MTKNDLPGIDALLGLMGTIGATTMHLTVGLPPVYRINGQITPLSELARVSREASALAKRIGTLKPEAVTMLANQLLAGDRHRQSLAGAGSASLAQSIPGVGRFRANVYTQRGSLAVVCHTLFERVPSLDLFPGDEIRGLLGSHGLILVCGQPGSGKTTLLAALIDHLNQAENIILAIEDPIEYLHTHRKGVVNQRQVGEDVPTYREALEAAMDQDVDVIALGDVPDGESVMGTVAAAETGRLVLAAVPTITAQQTVDRLLALTGGIIGSRMRLTGIISGVIALTRDHVAHVVPAAELTEEVPVRG